ncbi:MAG: AraC family transcriptional regulator [Treponema sp.]|jgi:AraC-like DNA-binding protein|nr:AraC family transcriptional regulator [Treponema sp.]
MLAAFISAMYINLRSNVRRDEEAADRRILYQMLVNIDYMDDTFKSLCYSAYTMAEVRTVMYLKEPDTYENCYSQLERLRRIQLQNSFIHSVQIYNYDKDVIYSTKNNPREDVSIRKIVADYGAAPRLKPILRQIDNNGADIFVLSYFMYDIVNEDGRMNGALVMNIQLNWLLSNIQRVNMMDSSDRNRLYVLTSDMQFLEASESSLETRGEFKTALVSALAGEFEKHGVPEEKGDSFTARIDKVAYLISVVSVKSSNWMILNVRSQSAVYQYMSAMLKNILLFASLCVIAFLMVSFILSRRIYRPIENLLENIRPLAAGIPLPAIDRDEFTWLKKVYESYEEHFQEYRQTAKAYTLRYLLQDSSEINEAGFARTLTEQGITLTLAEPFAVFIVSAGKTAQEKVQGSSPETERAMEKAERIFADALSPRFHFESLRLNAGSVCFILNAAADTLEELKAAVEAAQKQAEIPMIAALAGPQSGVNCISGLYNTAQRLLLYRFVLPGQLLITQAEVGRRDAETPYPYDMESRFLTDLEKHRCEEMSRHLAELIGRLRSMEIYNLHFYLRQMLSEVRKTLFRMNETLESPIDLQTWFSESLLLSLPTLDDFALALQTNLIDAASRPERRRNGDKSGEIMTQILDIIGDNYADVNLNAAELASMLKITPSALSRVFNENMKKSIPEYINTLRMEKAAEWLRNSKLSNREIMTRIGMENESYFYKVFKNQYGQNPSEYRLVAQITNGYLFCP